MNDVSKTSEGGIQEMVQWEVEDHFEAGCRSSVWIEGGVLYELYHTHSAAQTDTEMRGRE